MITAVYFANQTEQFSVTCTCVPTILSVHDIVSTLPITIIVEQNVHQLKLSERFGLAFLWRDAAYSRYYPGHCYSEMVPFPTITQVNVQQLTNKEHGYLCVHYITCHDYIVYTLQPRDLFLGSGV